MGRRLCQNFEVLFTWDRKKERPNQLSYLIGEIRVQTRLSAYERVIISKLILYSKALGQGHVEKKWKTKYLWGDGSLGGLSLRPPTTNVLQLR